MRRKPSRADTSACAGRQGSIHRRKSAYAARVFAARADWGFVLVVRLSGGWVGLEDREGVALRILTHGKPSHTRQTDLAHECFPAAFFDEIRTRIYCWNFDSDANGLARVFTSSEPTVDASRGAVTRDHAPIFLSAVRRVILPAYFELPSKHFSVEVDRSVGNVGGNSKMVDSWHALSYCWRFHCTRSPIVNRRYLELHCAARRPITNLITKSAAGYHPAPHRVSASASGTHDLPSLTSASRAANIWKLRTGRAGFRLSCAL
jgi:hypothetical protein